MSSVLITGGAGFVGTNLTHRLVEQGHEVVVLDNLSRPGVRRNMRWLRSRHRDGLRVVEGDVRDAHTVRQAVRGVDQVFHFAAQVAVTTSLTEPRHDFDVNLGGTITLLEEIRACPEPPAVLFTSTNKVYGGLDDVALVNEAGRYRPTDRPMASRGISESRPLSFCSPYGCSKGGADQYVVDYATSYGLRSVVFRMSCIYGRHQQGNEDQGWVAHFAKQLLDDRPITIYGDGHQVRDILFVDDLVDAMLLAAGHSDTLAGQAFNIGGGPGNAVSLVEVLDLLGGMSGHTPELHHDDWRVGDQRWYVSDTSRFREATGWSPATDVSEGIARLAEWLQGDARGIAEAG